MNINTLLVLVPDVNGSHINMTLIYFIFGYTSVTTAQPTCSDQSPKCMDHIYTTFLCANLDPISVEYAIATCPMTCNRCAEYGKY